MLFPCAIPTIKLAKLYCSVLKQTNYNYICSKRGSERGRTDEREERERERERGKGERGREGEKEIIRGGGEEA